MLSSRWCRGLIGWAMRTERVYNCCLELFFSKEAEEGKTTRKDLHYRSTQSSVGTVFTCSTLQVLWVCRRFFLSLCVSAILFENIYSK